MSDVIRSKSIYDEITIQIVNKKDDGVGLTIKDISRKFGMHIGVNEIKHGEKFNGEFFRYIPILSRDNEYEGIHEMMLDLSSKEESKDVEFILTCNENRREVGIWKAWYKNGKYKYTKGFIKIENVYEPFDEVEWK